MTTTDPAAKRPEAPASLNGEHGAMWRIIDHGLDQIDAVREEVRDLRGVLVKGSVSVSIALFALALTLATR